MGNSILGFGSGSSCKIASFFVCSLTYTSIGLFVILAIERYVAIIHPFKYNPCFSRKNSSAWLLVAPVYGFSIAVIPLFGWSGYARPHNNSHYCTFDFQIQSTKSYFIFTSIIVFVGPILLTAICFGLILVELRRTALETQRIYGKRSHITVQSSKAVIEQSLSLVFTGFVYFGCWTPYSVVCCYYFADQTVSFKVENIAKLMSKSSTISSTVVYCLIERRFRSFMQKEVTTKMRKISRTFERMSMKQFQETVID